MTKIFVYGTLREGMYNYEKYLKGRVRLKQQAYVKGLLYNIKGVVYPALLPGDQWICGEIMEIEDDMITKELDELESYYGEGNIHNEYDKQMMDIYDKDKHMIAQLPVYLFNLRNPKHQNCLGEIISSGDYVVSIS